MTIAAFDTPYRGGFVGSEHRFALSVYFEDTDTAQIVYYAKQDEKNCGARDRPILRSFAL